LVRVDFEKNASINGAGITGMTNLLKQYHDQQVRIGLTGLSSNFKAVFETLGITRMVDMLDENEATATSH